MCSSLEICSVKSGKSCSAAVLSTHVRFPRQEPPICVHVPPADRKWQEMKRKLKWLVRKSAAATGPRTVPCRYGLACGCEGRERAVVLFSGFCGFHLPGLPAWVPLPSPQTVHHEREWTSAEWHGGDCAKQLISTMLVHCSLLRCQFPFSAWRVCKGQVNS